MNNNWPFPPGAPLSGLAGSPLGTPAGAGFPTEATDMASMAEGLGKFVPGFDFLQTLAKGAGSVVPSMSQWVAPTISVEELEKRIEELKAVQFWLDQNAKMIGTTIQALEVQKMSLSTLKAMNFNLGDVAQALKARVATAAFGPGTEATAESSAPASARRKPPARKASTNASAKSAGSPIDPMQWWGALTQQFAQIAGQAVKEATTKTTADVARQMATGVASSMAKTARDAGVRATQAGVQAGLAAGMAGAGLAAGAAKQAAKTAAKVAGKAAGGTARGRSSALKARRTR